MHLLLRRTKKSNEMERKASWDRYMDANDRWKNSDSQIQAKAEIKSGLLKRIKEKEDEHDSFELQISNVDLSHIDEREQSMRIEVERKTNQLAGREFESNIRQKQSEIYNNEQKIKAFPHEGDQFLLPALRLSKREASLSILAVLLNGCGPSASVATLRQEVELERYTDSKEGFTLLKPSSWGNRLFVR